MEQELWELDQLGFKKKKNRPRLDKHGRRLFDKEGNYIPPQRRISTGIMSELNKMDDRPRKEWYTRQMKIRNQRIKEDIEYGDQ